MDAEADTQAVNHPLPLHLGRESLMPDPVEDDQRRKLVRLLGRILARHWLRERRELRGGFARLDNNLESEGPWQPAPSKQPDG